MKSETVSRVSTWLDSIHPSWTDTFTPVADQLHLISSHLDQAGPYQPADEQVLRAFSWPRSQCKVVLIGQDPYPTLGTPVGLSFAVNTQMGKVPASLRNIVREWSSDLEQPWPAGTIPDLVSWAEQGVLLINTSLTVSPGKAGSHSSIGWLPVVTHVLQKLCRPLDTDLQSPPVVLAWGNHAQKVAKYAQAPHVVAAAHPSPLSAYRGFIGSRPFTRTNAMLDILQREPLSWSLRFAEAQRQT